MMESSEPLDLNEPVTVQEKKRKRTKNTHGTHKMKRAKSDIIGPHDKLELRSDDPVPPVSVKCEYDSDPMDVHETEMEGGTRLNQQKFKPDCSEIDPAYEILLKYVTHKKKSGYREMLEELSAKGLSLDSGYWKPCEVEQLRQNWENFKACHNYIEEPVKLLFPNKYPDEYKGLRQLIKETSLRQSLGYNIMRPIWIVFKKAQREFVTWKSGKVSEEELGLIKKMKSQGEKWINISAVLERPDVGIRLKHTRRSRNYIKGKWTKKEDKLLLETMKSQRYYCDLKKKHYYAWEQISKTLNRPGDCCRLRYIHVLAWKQQHQAEYRPHFSSRDKILLIEEVCEEFVQSESEIQWSNIVKSFNNVSTESSLRSRWHELKTKVPMYQIKTLDEITDYLVDHEMPKLQRKLERKLKKAEERAAEETQQGEEALCKLEMGEEVVAEPEDEDRA